jgi:hypothetical protein
MTILLAALAITVSAFCVWLTVRTVNRRERWAKWTLAGLVGLPVLYIASFGPACWLTSNRYSVAGGPLFGRKVPRAFHPICIAERRCPKLLSSAIKWYATLGIGDSLLVGPQFRDHTGEIHTWLAYRVR